MLLIGLGVSHFNDKVRKIYGSERPYAAQNTESFFLPFFEVSFLFTLFVSLVVFLLNANYRNFRCRREHILQGYSRGQ